MLSRRCVYSCVAATLFATCSAHSWVEEMQVIGSNGSYTGDYGYTRGYMSRTEAGYNGNSMDYLLPPLTSGRTRINGSDLLCHPSQRTSNYSSTYPRLQVVAGEYVAMKYLENGHVTLPETQLGKPEGAGTVFIYATTEPSTTEKIVDVLEWTAGGTGGDGRGTLIAANNFDDGRCHQLNSGTISQQRQAEFPDRVPGQPTSQSEQWCETDVQIPSSATTGETLTLYWVWQWPTAPGADPTYPTGKDEYYTSCLEMDIVAKQDTAAPVHTLEQQDPQTNAVTSYRSRTAYTESPSVTLASQTASSAAYTSASASATTLASVTASTYAADSTSSSSFYNGTEGARVAGENDSIGASSASASSSSSSPSSSSSNSMVLPLITYSLSYLPSYTSTVSSSAPSSAAAAAASSTSSYAGHTNTTASSSGEQEAVVTVTQTVYITPAASTSASSSSQTEVQVAVEATVTEMATTMVTVTARAAVATYGSVKGKRAKAWIA